ncbi:MAG: hypothetical protein KatS3mg126_0546 [Lysobacteraceae bacterium]|nr:MAG: hypothetical protein KatS3mg126_0546 [Xanthomonadaceae bacterium]
MGVDLSQSTLLALGALVAASLGWACWPGRAARHARGLRRLLALVLALLALLAGALGWTLRGYLPWRPGSLVAEVAVRAEAGGGAPQRFLVEVALPGRTPERFVLEGDQWQIDVRLLRWRPFLAVLGAPRLFLPERIGARHADLDAERRRPRSVHALHGEERGLEWRWMRRLLGWLPVLEADFGSSAYLPLIDGTRFRVEVGDQGGIVALPADARTAERLATQDW